MDIIDDTGRLFGLVNVIDALVVVLIVAVVAAGATLVVGDDERSEPLVQQTTVTIEINNLQPYVVDAISEGPTGGENIVAVQNKSVRPTQVVVGGQDGPLREESHPRKKTVTLQLLLNTTHTPDGILYENKEIEIGRDMTFDLGRVTVTGQVVDVAEVEQ